MESIKYSVAPDFGAGKSEAEPKVEVLKSASNKYCFTREILFSSREDEYEPKTGAVFTVKVSLNLTGPPYNTRTPRTQSGSAGDVLPKRDTKDAVKLMDNVMDFGIHAHILCSEISFYH